ncbi:hypothetical protein [Streptomyces syringium]
MPNLSAVRTALATESGRVIAYGRRPWRGTRRGTRPRTLFPSP